MGKEKTVVVLSGGQDSTTALYWALHDGMDVAAAVTFDYNQRHSREIEAATIITGMAGVPHEIITLGPILKGRSPLTDPNAQLEQYQDYQQMDKVIGDRVELTFVPMRNALFLTIAANRAICLDAHSLVTGVCQADNANYPDCRKSFIMAQEEAINQALGIEDFMIYSPLMNLPKWESVKLAQTLPGCMEALAYTHTAYDGSYPPIGKDHATILRAHGFEQAGVPDPLIIRAWKEGLMELPGTGNYDSLIAS